jgi:hypothetical protein
MSNVGNKMLTILVYAAQLYGAGELPMPVQETQDLVERFSCV